MFTAPSFIGSLWHLHGLSHMALQLVLQTQGTAHQQAGSPQPGLAQLQRSWMLLLGCRVAGNLCALALCLFQQDQELYTKSASHSLHFSCLASPCQPCGTLALPSCCQTGGCDNHTPTAFCQHTMQPVHSRVSNHPSRPQGPTSQHLEISRPVRAQLA